MPIADNSQIIPATSIPSEDQVVLSTLPKMVTALGLCKLMHISHSTFRNWQKNRPELIPRGINLGSDNLQMLRFYVSDVREKLKEIRERHKYIPSTPAINRLLEIQILDDVIPPMPPGVEIEE